MYEGQRFKRRTGKKSKMLSKSKHEKGKEQIAHISEENFCKFGLPKHNISGHVICFAREMIVPTYN